MNWNWGGYLFGWLGIVLHLLVKFTPDILSTTEISWKPVKMLVAAWGASIAAISYTILYAAGAEGMLAKIGIDFSWGYFTAALLGFAGSSIFQNIASVFLKTTKPAEG
jgi:hypothetical protein